MYSTIKLSVITINYNNFEGLKKTLKSVLKQKKCSFELIVVDGKSSDSSIQLINENEKIINKKIIEKDKGIFDAMNKGLRLAEGKYVFFLNSGEIMIEDNAFYNFCSVIDKSNENIISGDSLFSYDGKKYFKMNFRRYWNHQSVLIKREMNLNYLYDINLKILGDLDFWIRIEKNGSLNVKKTNLKFVKMILDGVGTSDDYVKIKFYDKLYIVKKHPFDLYQIISLFRLALKIIFK